MLDIRLGRPDPRRGNRTEVRRLAIAAGLLLDLFGFRLGLVAVVLLFGRGGAIAMTVDVAVARAAMQAVDVRMGAGGRRNCHGNLLSKKRETLFLRFASRAIGVRNVILAFGGFALEIIRHTAG